MQLARAPHSTSGDGSAPAIVAAPSDERAASGRSRSSAYFHPFLPIRQGPWAPAAPGYRPASPGALPELRPAPPHPQRPREPEPWHHGGPLAARGRAGAPGPAPRRRPHPPAARVGRVRRLADQRERVRRSLLRVVRVRGRRAGGADAARRGRRGLGGRRPDGALHVRALRRPEHALRPAPGPQRRVLLHRVRPGVVADGDGHAVPGQGGVRGRAPRELRRRGRERGHPVGGGLHDGAGPGRPGGRGRERAGELLLRPRQLLRLEGDARVRGALRAGQRGPPQHGPGRDAHADRRLPHPLDGPLPAPRRVPPAAHRLPPGLLPLVLPLRHARVHRLLRPQPAPLVHPPGECGAARGRPGSPGSPAPRAPDQGCPPAPARRRKGG